MGVMLSTTVLVLYNLSLYKEIYRGKSKLGKQVVKAKPLNESVLYPEGLTERMNPVLEDDLRERRL